MAHYECVLSNGRMQVLKRFHTEQLICERCHKPLKVGDLYRLHYPPNPENLSPRMKHATKRHHGRIYHKDSWESLYIDL